MAIDTSRSGEEFETIDIDIDPLSLDKNLNEELALAVHNLDTLSYMFAHKLFYKLANLQTINYDLTSCVELYNSGKTEEAKEKIAILGGISNLDESIKEPILACFESVILNLTYDQSLHINFENLIVNINNQFDPLGRISNSIIELLDLNDSESVTNLLEFCVQFGYFKPAVSATLSELKSTKDLTPIFEQRTKLFQKAIQQSSQKVYAKRFELKPVADASGSFPKRKALNNPFQSPINEATAKLAEEFVNTAISTSGQLDHSKGEWIPNNHKDQLRNYQDLRNMVRYFAKTNNPRALLIAQAAYKRATNDAQELISNNQYEKGQQLFDCADIFKQEIGRIESKPQPQEQDSNDILNDEVTLTNLRDQIIKYQDDPEMSKLLHETALKKGRELTYTQTHKTRLQGLEYLRLAMVSARNFDINQVERIRREYDNASAFIAQQKPVERIKHPKITKPKSFISRHRNKIAAAAMVTVLGGIAGVAGFFQDKISNVLSGSNIAGASSVTKDPKSTEIQQKDLPSYTIEEPNNTPVLTTKNAPLPTKDDYVFSEAEAKEVEEKAEKTIQVFNKETRISRSPIRVIMNQFFGDVPAKDRAVKMSLVYAKFGKTAEVSAHNSYNAWINSILKANQVTSVDQLMKNARRSDTGSIVLPDTVLAAINSVQNDDFEKVEEDAAKSRIQNTRNLRKQNRIIETAPAAKPQTKGTISFNPTDQEVEQFNETNKNWTLDQSGPGALFGKEQIKKPSLTSRAKTAINKSFKKAGGWLKKIFSRS